MLVAPRTAVLCLLVLTLSCWGTTRTQLPGRSAVLLPEQAEVLLRQCSRAVPRAAHGTWVVPQEMVSELEANLGKLKRLRADECCILRARVREPWSYFRQYVGIEVDGRRLVYINAFRSAEGHGDWRETPALACDGGDDYWGAVYDPATKEFSQLAFNGVG